MTPAAYEFKKLGIPDSYLREEIREGFTIPEKMKRAWAAKLQLLSWMGEIFDKNGLSWWVDWGSLIGAIRCRGIIPWDDDIDISMPREDFEKAVPLLRENLPSHCEVHRYNAVNITTCVYVMNRRRTDYGDDEEERRITDLFFGCPYMCAIDIFPLDFIPDDKTDAESWKYLGDSVYCVATNYDKYEREGILEEQLSLIEEITGQPIPRGDGARSALLKLLDQISRMYTGEESSAVAVYAVWLLNRKERPLSLYARSVRVPFEMITVPVPVGYCQILSMSFGNWYVPVKGTTTHGYPFYQEDELRIREHDITAITSAVEAAENGGGENEAGKLLKEGLDRYPDSFELNYYYGAKLLSSDAIKGVGYLKKSAELCTYEEVKQNIEDYIAKAEEEIRKVMQSDDRD